MNIKELLERRAKLLAEIESADEKRFADIKAEIAKIDYTVEQLKADEARAATEAHEAELRAAREKTPAPVEGTAKKVIAELGAQQTDTTNERAATEAAAIEERAKTLKDGGKVNMRAAFASSSTALGTVASNTINPAFEQVGSLDELVNQTHLEGTGAEAYKKPFVKSYGEGVITAEGASPSATAEPTMAYASINKVKIVAYAEVTEEVAKLPAANYLAEVNKAVLGAWRKKVIGQIVNGSGSGELVGILNTPVSIIEATQRKTIATIDENTLDNIIFDYGGDESVEGDAWLVLNKLTLKEFAKVKGADKRRAYDIVVHGNTGTINGVPFVCTSKLPAYASVTAGNAYMIYGKLAAYELTFFADLDVEQSREYKFKEGIIAYKATGMVGGSTAAFNAFMSVQKALGGGGGGGV